MMAIDSQLHKIVDSLHSQHTTALAHYLCRFPLDQITGLLQLVIACEGHNVYFTGIGKSGAIAQKLAATLASCGLHSFYLCSVSALHGDMGVVHPGDLVVFLSRSGETDEILNLASFVKDKGAKSAAIICESRSKLAHIVDHSISVPLEKETGQWEMIPTLSATIQLMIGDLIALAYVESKKLSRDLFAINHPGGRIGKRLTLKVGHLMIQGEKLPLCTKDVKTKDCLTELSLKKSGCVLIVDDKQNLEGIFTDGDLRRSLQKYGEKVLEMPLERVMTPSPRVIDEKALAYQALQEMEAVKGRPITVLPVLREKKAFGLIRLHDLLQAGL